MARRHESIVPLSREHHDALTLAFRLRHPAPPGPVTPVTPESTPALRAQWTREHFATALAPHFADESSVLFPALRAAAVAHPELTALLDGLEADHVDLTRLHDAIAGTTDPSELEPLLTAFGDRLESHVRTEERQLFAHLEGWLSAAALTTVGRALDERRAARGATCSAG